jgi:polyvinyl alcohol dehydrogenase (cytochrome)
VWGSSLVPDTSRGLLYVTTGNDYSVPPDVAICTQTALTQAQQLQCMAPDNYVDAVLALDLNSGAVRWDDRLQGADAWDFPCFLGPQAANCPTPSGPDYDFGAGVNFIDTVDAAGKPLQLIGAGEKSGMYWALNPDNGQVVWRTRVGPGGLDGGMEWGSATDGKRVYVAIADLELRKYQLGPDYKTEHRGGSWAALDAATGAVIWQVPETGKNPLVPSLPAASSAALTVANGVVYAGSQSGDMVALDAATGATLWKYHTRGTVMDGPSVVDGWLYWGSGYNNLVITGKPDNKVYAFALP